MFKDFVFKKQELSFRKSCFIFAAVTIFVYRYDRMTVSIRIGCPLYRYCIDTDCIVPALIRTPFKEYEHATLAELIYSFVPNFFSSTLIVPLSPFPIFLQLLHSILNTLKISLVDFVVIHEYYFHFLLYYLNAYF